MFLIKKQGILCYRRQGEVDKFLALSQNLWIKTLQKDFLWLKAALRAPLNT